MVCSRLFVNQLRHAVLRCEQNSRCNIRCCLSGIKQINMKIFNERQNWAKFSCSHVILPSYLFWWLCLSFKRIILCPSKWYHSQNDCMFCFCCSVCFQVSSFFVVANVLLTLKCTVLAKWLLLPKHTYFYRHCMIWFFSVEKLQIWYKFFCSFLIANVQSVLTS